MHSVDQGGSATNQECFSVVFQGVAEGHKPDEVRHNLAALLKADPEKLAVLFRGRPVVVKRSASHDTAVKYKTAFEKAGARCEIRDTETIVPTHGSEPGHQGNKISCPGCGLHQEISQARAGCGMALEKPEKPHKAVHEERGLCERDGSADDDMCPKPTRVRHVASLKAALFSAAVIALVGGFAVLDTFYLKGEKLSQGSVKIHDTNAYLSVPVSRSQTKYMVEVYTEKSVTLRFRVEGPDGQFLCHNTESGDRKGRRVFVFEPRVRGVHKLFVGTGASTPDAWGDATVTIHVNERRVLPRILRWSAL
jgi:hypothetical protein